MKYVKSALENACLYSWLKTTHVHQNMHQVYDHNADYVETSATKDVIVK